MQDNRRRYTRFVVPVEVEVAWDAGAIVVATDDVGAGGCRIALPAPPPVGTLMKVSLRAGSAGPTASGVARVVWAWPAEGAEPGACGLAFAPSLVEAMVPLLRTLVGDRPLETP